jgi:hypothetical protein
MARHAHSYDKGHQQQTTIRLPRLMGEIWVVEHMSQLCWQKWRMFHWMMQKSDLGREWLATDVIQIGLNRIDQLTDQLSMDVRSVNWAELHVLNGCPKATDLDDFENEAICMWLNNFSDKQQACRSAQPPPGL